MGAFVDEEDGEVDLVARSLTELEEDLFPGVAADERRAAVGGLLRLAAADASEGRLQLREHMFFRNISGVWACSDPACDQAVNHPGRTVGRLFDRPRYACPCGGRVLQLWYCQTCGDVLLGGYATLVDQFGGEWLLLAEASNLTDVPERTHQSPTSENYVLFWPRRGGVLQCRSNWPRTQDGGAIKVDNRFEKSEYDPTTGLLANDPNASDPVWSFHVTVKKGSDDLAERIPPEPTKCPACGDEPGIKRTLPLASPGAWRSTIRGMRTGLAMTSQVLTDGVLQYWRDVEGDRASSKAVAFSDSRQDAARLAGGLELYHHRQLVRQGSYGVVRDSAKAGAELASAVDSYRSEGFEGEAAAAFIQ